jgi:acetolactate synthase I/II/III large subunit
MATTVEVMIEAFRSAGTPFLVGHPGGESTELMEAARQRDVRFILVKQETAGAMLAATWGEITGAPGVCLSTRAPGAANMVNGVAHAWMDRSPLIAITDQYPAATYETGLRQRLNQLELYRPITKWNATVSADVVRQLMRRALRTATAFPPGPVQLDLPANQTRLEAAELRDERAFLPDWPALAPEPASLGPAVQRIRRARALGSSRRRADGLCRAARWSRLDHAQSQRGPA